MMQGRTAHPPPAFDDRWALLIDASERLAAARSLERIVEILRDSARQIVGADGIAVVLRDGEQCHYVAEDAMAPLWAGQKFPLSSCVSGWAMTHRQTVAIPDVRLDPRIPMDAYAPTFVRSLLMAPIGSDPIAALGAYWARVQEQSPDAMARLQALARAAAIAVHNVHLAAEAAGATQRLRELADSLEQRVDERGRELARTQEALRQSQKLEAMGQLTGGVAHDFNNLLTPIMGCLDIVRRRTAPDDRHRRLVDAALQSAQRARSLIQRLLAFARRQPLQPVPVDIEQLLVEMSVLVATTIGPQIELALDIGEQLPAALADRNQVEMAVLNLAVNARDAMPLGGRLTISAQTERVSGTHAAGLEAGDYVRISIIDTGTGMSDETQRRAVEPFYSTKGVGQGTGLGLSMVHGLASQLGGGLRLQSALGEGTRVDLWIPSCHSLRIESPPAQEAVAPPQGGLALLVDDEPLVRASTAAMLGDLGFQVLEAASAGEAMQALEAHPQIALLVTDHLMPQMTGGELARAAHARWPRLGILIVSGFIDQDTPPEFPRLGKPFSQEELAGGVAAARRGHLASTRS